MEFCKRVITHEREDLVRKQHKSKKGSNLFDGIVFGKNALALRPRVVVVRASYLPCLRMWVCHRQCYTSNFNFVYEYM